ncbi:MAG: penicillin-binding protein 2 [Acidimicrobiaceae bacterium]|nr:penicillin-binding protein 2 [Acidimicrobiaceae bacterium]
MNTHQTPTHNRGQYSSRPVARYARRYLLLRGLLILGFAVVALRLVQIQVVRHATLARESLAQVRQTVPTPALRAGIYDRYGQVLAISEPTDMVIADDFQISSPATEAAALSGLVHIPTTKLTRLLSEHNGYVILNSALDLTDGKAVAAAYFPGIVVESSSTRHYPNATLAQSLIGGTNAAGVGDTGLEYEYQNQLAGQPGEVRQFVSQSGVPLPSSPTVVLKHPVPGVGLELTIDNQLQFVTERYLGAQIAATQGVAGAAVVMDVKTGEILADASLVNTKQNPGVLGPIPSWGTSIGVPGIEQTINNLPFTAAYEPGSVFKIVTFSAALNDGLITPNTPFTIPGQILVGGRIFHDAEPHGTETLTATQVIAQSSNIGTYEIGARVGEAGILAQVERMGFGHTTAVNYPGETAGLLVSAATWYPSDAGSLPIGQVDAVPPIQVLDAFNTLANGGTFVEPRLVRGYVQPSGHVVAAPASPTRSVITPAVSSTLTKMLEQVVLAGTGTNAIIPGYLVAGKTGTSQIPVPGQAAYLPGEFYATFVGFAPANKPVLSMIVVIERPLTTIYGGSASAPVFKEVMSYALRHYGIPSSGVVVHPLAGSASLGSDVTW